MQDDTKKPGRKKKSLYAFLDVQALKRERDAAAAEFNKKIEAAQKTARKQRDNYLYAFGVAFEASLKQMTPADRRAVMEELVKLGLRETDMKRIRMGFEIIAAAESASAPPPPPPADAESAKESEPEQAEEASAGDGNDEADQDDEAPAADADMSPDDEPEPEQDEGGDADAPEPAAEAVQAQDEHAPGGWDRLKFPYEPGTHRDRPAGMNKFGKHVPAGGVWSAIDKQNKEEAKRCGKIFWDDQWFIPDGSDFEKFRDFLPAAFDFAAAKEW